MRSAGSGPLGALFMLAPLVAIPVLAVVGIPQFAPTNTSAAPEAQQIREPGIPSPENRVGSSARDSEDLFAPLNSKDLQRFSDPLAEPRGRRGRPSGNTQYGTLDDLQGDAFEEDDLLAPAEFEEEANAESAPRVDPRRQRLAQGLKGGQRPSSRKRTEEQFADASFGEEETSPRGSSASPVKRGPSRPSVGSRNSSMAGDSAEVESVSNPFEPDNDASDNSHPQIRRAPEGQNIAPAGEELPDAPLFKPKGKKAPLPVVEQPAEELSENSELPPQTEPAVGDNSPAESGVEEITWSDAVKRLRELGVKKHYFTYLEETDTFLFTCSVTAPGNPRTLERFEAEAEEPLLAVHDVLRQLQGASGSKPRRGSASGE